MVRCDQSAWLRASQPRNHRCNRKIVFARRRPKPRLHSVLRDALTQFCGTMQRLLSHAPKPRAHWTVDAVHANNACLKTIVLSILLAKSFTEKLPPSFENLR